MHLPRPIERMRSLGLGWTSASTSCISVGDLILARARFRSRSAGWPPIGTATAMGLLGRRRHRCAHRVLRPTIPFVVSAVDDRSARPFPEPSMRTAAELPSREECAAYLLPRKRVVYLRRRQARCSRSRSVRGSCGPIRRHPDGADPRHWQHRIAADHRGWQSCLCSRTLHGPRNTIVAAAAGLKHDALKSNQGTSRIHRHCERSEAIQGPQHWGLDCFGAARLAMTNSQRDETGTRVGPPHHPVRAGGSVPRTRRYGSRSSHAGGKFQSCRDPAMSRSRCRRRRR